MTFLQRNKIALILLVAAAVVATPAMAAASSLRKIRQLTTCGALTGCYLRDLKTGSEVALIGNGDSYTVEDGNSGYSIRCDVTDDAYGGEINYIKFFYDDKVQDEFGEPRWMNGDSDMGAYVNPVPYLSTCGHKTLNIEGHIWSNKCFEKTFQLEAKCPVKPPTPAPVKPPTPAPVKPPTPAPVKPPTPAPVKPPTPAPVKPPTPAPVKPPTPAPVKPPTPAPVKPPTKAPCPNFKCPSPFVPTPGKECIRSIADCQCDFGYSPYKGRCKCSAKYYCPKNADKIKYRDCYRSFADCQCKAGYKAVNEQCVCDDSFQCPANSTRKSDKCYGNIKDCECNKGFKQSGNTCIKYKYDKDDSDDKDDEDDHDGDDSDDEDDEDRLF